MSQEPARLIHGDCLEVMRTLASASVDAIVTDPPYALTAASRNGSPRNNDPATPYGRTRLGERGFMGKTWDTGETAFSVEIWTEALRVLKPGGHILSFGGTRTYHRLVCAIEDAGFEIRDQVGWLFGQGFPKSLNIGGGFGTALKPAWEPICVARKPLLGTVAENVARFGTGALNIDGCRVPTIDGANLARLNKVGENGWKNSSRGPNRAASDPVAASGRWPANLIHDGSDEVLAAFAAFGEKTSNSTGKGGMRGIGFGGGASRSMCAPRPTDTGTAARFFYTAKASKADRDAGLEGLAETPTATLQDNGGNFRTGTGNERTTTRRNVHPTVKPTSLMRYLCRLSTPPGGVVLDPFMGSGSTGRGAVLEGFRFIGIEREAEYVEIARRRIADAEQTVHVESPVDLFTVADERISA